MSIGIWQIAIVVILVVLLFGEEKYLALWEMLQKASKVQKGMASDVTDSLNLKIFPQKIRFK